MRKNLDTTVGAGAAGNTLSFVLSTGKEESLETIWFQGFPLIGGDKRDRTADLLNAIYSPDMLVGRFHYRIDTLLPIDFTGKKGH